MNYTGLMLNTQPLPYKVIMVLFVSIKRQCDKNAKIGF